MVVVMVAEVYNLLVQVPKVVEAVDPVVAVVVMILVDHMRVVQLDLPHKEMMVEQEQLLEQMLVEVAEH